MTVGVDFSMITQLIGALLGGVIVGGGGWHIIFQRTNGNGKNGYLKEEKHTLVCENTLLKFEAMLTPRFDRLEKLIKENNT